MKRLIPLVLLLAGVSSGWALTAFPGVGSSSSGGGGSGVTIGDSVSGGTVQSVLYTDNAGNVGNSSDFTYSTSTNFLTLGAPSFGGVTQITVKPVSTSYGMAFESHDFSLGTTGGILFFSAYDPIGIGAAFDGASVPGPGLQFKNNYLKTSRMMFGNGSSTALAGDGLEVVNGDILISTTSGSRGIIFQDGTTQTIAMPNGTKLRQLTVVLDGGGAEISTGTKNVFIRISSDITLTGWDIVADQTGSIVVDFWKDTYANFPPDVSDTFAGAEKPTLSSAIKAQDTSLSSMTTSLSAGDYIEVNVESVTDVTKVIISLYGVVN